MTAMGITEEIPQWNRNNEVILVKANLSISHYNYYYNSIIVDSN